MKKMLVVALLIPLLFGCAKEKVEEAKETIATTKEAVEYVHTPEIKNIELSNEKEFDLKPCECISKDPMEIHGSSICYIKEGPFSLIEMERYTNNTYGYTIDVPRSWGVISQFGSGFYDCLNDEMGLIGYLGTSYEAEQNYIEISVTKRTNRSALNDYESPFDFYKDIPLKDKSYITDEKFNDSWTKEKDYTLMDFEEFNKDDEYLRTHRVISNGKNLYVFIYDKNNSIHKEIVDSIELNEMN